MFNIEQDESRYELFVEAIAEMIAQYMINEKIDIQIEGVDEDVSSEL